MSSTAYHSSQVDRHRLLYPILATEGATLSEKDDEASRRSCYFESHRIPVSRKGESFEVSPSCHQVQDNPLSGQIQELLLGVCEEYYPTV
jgi:hypothetical protein